MSKLSNPSRTVSQFVYDFSAYSYANSEVETKTINQVKKITQNTSSDDGIKEIQLELLWKGLKRSTGNNIPSKNTSNADDKPKSKSALKKERKAKRKKEAALKKYRWDANDLDKKKPKAINVNRTTLKAPKSKGDSWANAPSWNEVKSRTQQSMDPKSKMDLVDSLSDHSLSEQYIEKPLSIDSELLSGLRKYNFDCYWNSTSGVDQLLLKQVDSPSTFLSIVGSSNDQKLEVLNRAFRLFTYKSNYTGEQEQKQTLDKVLSFMWSTQLKRYSINKKIKIPKRIRKKRFGFVSTASLLHSQFSWNNLSAIEKAYLIINIRHRLGFSTNIEPLANALVQPTIYEQWLEERRVLASETKTSQIVPDIIASSKDIDNQDGSDEKELLQKIEHVDTDEVTTTDKQASIGLTNSHREFESTDIERIPIDAELNAQVRLIESTFRWPSTIAFEADGSLPEIQWPQVGVLKAVGYSVGVQGLAERDRLTILKNVYMESLPYVDSKSYMAEWGEPQSSTRLKKMAETLASLTKGAKRKTQANMSVAIREWEHDLAWLKKQYYLEHKFVWVWPSVGNKSDSQELDAELMVASEKQYISAREFLSEQYTNDANELCCQICQTALPFKLDSGEYFWEETPVNEKIDSSPFSDLVLCPNHRAMYIHANLDPNQLLGSLGDGFSKNISIELASENVSVFVSELHQEKLRSVADSVFHVEGGFSESTFDFTQISKGLQGVKKLYLYEKGSDWVVSSRAKVLNILPSKTEALNWISAFDQHREVMSTVTEKIPTAKPKKTKKPKSMGISPLSVASVRFGTVKKAEPQSSYKSGYSLCTTCNGDGGINGGCWKCGGSGWM